MELSLLVHLALVQAAPEPLPARFESGRVIVTPATRDGSDASFYTDTGGGVFITAGAVKRLGLHAVAATDKDMLDEAGPDAQVVVLPGFRPGKSIPAPPGDGKLLVLAADRVGDPAFHEDGMLGAAWFAGRVWTWDYPSHTFSLQTDWHPEAGARPVPLGFKTRADGTQETHFPRITIRVDDKPLDVLLDTGAETRLTANALAALNDGKPEIRATSMIVQSQFNAWRSAHPDWRVVEDAQVLTHAAMIEVPQVEIAGARVGPVWFTLRPDRSFHQFMSSMMDKRIEGAIGGNALEHFVMTIDYPNASAYFRCAKECMPTP